MMIWFTSDHHFGHANIIKYTYRPFDNVNDMDTELIKRWNERVSSEDIVYHLGDFTLGSLDTFNYYAKQLRGNIKIVPGGHDTRWLTKYDNSNKRIQVLDWLIMPTNILPRKDGYSVALTMCHYPMVSWEQSHYGAPHLHGHTHGTIGTISIIGDKQLPPRQKQGVRIDVSVDNWNFYPISLEHIIEIVGIE